MRFDELHLLKYGNFEGCGVAFPKQPVDFHVIFGANEAGKSTTLAAVGDLLFGFPHGISQAYRFDASLLRVGVFSSKARNGHRFGASADAGRSWMARIIP